jgi:high affinity Mn2+ porin
VKLNLSIRFHSYKFRILLMAIVPSICTCAQQVRAQDLSAEIAQLFASRADGSASSRATSGENESYQNWNWHLAGTVVAQGDTRFPAKYNGPQSLNQRGEAQETTTADVFAGVRLWRGAEAHVDGLMWEGFGLSKTFGVEAFPSADAYKVGTTYPFVMFARLFIRQTIGLGGEQEDVPDDQLTLAGKQDISRLTFTLGRMCALDIFDHNTYAEDPQTQFLNWAMAGNLAFDYAADPVGFTTGATAELNQSKWALRYGFFVMGGLQNQFSGEDQVLMWRAPAEPLARPGTMVRF